MSATKVVMVTAVDGVTPRGKRPGVVQHVRRKQHLLESAGFVVDHVSIGMAAKLDSVKALPTVLRIPKTSTAYVRLSTRTLIPVAALAVRRNPLVLEVNGLLDQFLPGVLRKPLRASLKRLAKRSNVTVVGDRSWHEYAKSLFGPDHRFVLLPLTPSVERVEPKTPTQTVVFAGAFTKYQGLDVLVEAWEGCDPSNQWKLIFHGDGPLADDLRALSADDPTVEVREMLLGDDYLDRLATAGVLVGHYPGVGLPEYRRSMLKTCDYAVTDRPFVTNDLDTLLDDLHASDQGVFVWDRKSAASLREAIMAAMQAVTGEQSWPDRWESLRSARGEPVQVAALKSAVVPT